MDLDQWTEPNKNPDGSKNKFAKPLKDFARKGYIGLQDHGRPVWYRNIKIKKLELKPTADANQTTTPTCAARRGFRSWPVAARRNPQTMHAANYTLVPDDYGMTLKSPEGRVVFTYMTRKPAKSNLAANSTCCFHPLNTPSGERLTDLAPGDHHHHRGVFLAWHTMEFREKADFTTFGPLGPTRGFNINRGDFWGWGQFAPTAGRVITNRSIKLADADAPARDRRDSQRLADQRQNHDGRTDARHRARAKRRLCHGP